MKFNSQICTTREQSERLIALGLKKETADMIHVDYGGRNYIIRPYDWLPTSKVDMEKYIPAWSMHRLMQMMPTPIKCRNSHEYADLYVNCELVQYRFYDTDYMHDVCYEHFNDGNVYDNVIDCMEWLIKEGYFPKEYWRNSMRARKKPSQSWIERSKYEIENEDRLLAERQEQLKGIRKKKLKEK